MYLFYPAANRCHVVSNAVEPPPEVKPSIVAKKSVIVKLLLTIEVLAFVIFPCVVIAKL